jgi:hypothetical protein
LEISVMREWTALVDRATYACSGMSVTNLDPLFAVSEIIQTDGAIFRPRFLLFFCAASLQLCYYMLASISDVKLNAKD